LRVAEGSLDRSPAWSPDGKWLAFTTDAFGQDDIGLYALDGGEIRWIRDPQWEVVSPGPIFGTSAVAWSPDGTRLAYCRNRAGNVDVVVRDVQTGSEMVFDTPEGQRQYPAFAPDGKHILFVYDGPRHPPDVWAGSLHAPQRGSATQLTESLVSQVSRASLVEPECVWYPSFDGRQISGFLYTPRIKAPGSPAVLWVHGGPTWQYRNMWDPVVQFLASRGYAVLAPNIRGSTGYGKAFRELAIGDWGGGDLKDLVAGAEYLERTGVAGRGRVAVAGASYGGYMTLLAMSKTPDRWAAGVSICGIVNLETLYESTRGDLRLYLIQQIGTPEDNPALYWDRSPVNFADDVKSPLMIVQGGADPRVPLREAEQMAQALARRGAILEYKVYPDEGHDLMKLENKLDCFAAMVNFFDKHMLG
jgi:dipeptidyl aminopeptidase/acylaminoacyl peptidase